MGTSGLRLAYFTQGYSPHDLRFLRAFVQQGLCVFFVSVPGKICETRLHPQGVESLVLPSFQRRWSLADLLRERAAMERRIAAWRPDVMLAGPLHSGGWLASTLSCAPLVAMSHGFDLLYVLPSDRTSERRIQRVLRRASAFFADCPALLQQGAKLRKFRAEETICLPWGIDRNLDVKSLAEGKALRRSLGWEQAVVLVSLRRWEPVYAVPELIEAFARCAARDPSVRLILGGDGSARETVRQLLHDFDLTQKVHCPGDVSEDQVWTLLGAADGYVSSARSDGSSISLLQAMAVGLPAIVNDTGGNRDWITEGAHGWFFSVGTPGSFEQAVAQFLAARPDWTAIGEANREKVSQNADWETNQRLLAGFLQEVARRG